MPAETHPLSGLSPPTVRTGISACENGQLASLHQPATNCATRLRYYSVLNYCYDERCKRHAGRPLIAESASPVAKIDQGRLKTCRLAATHPVSSPPPRPLVVDQAEQTILKGCREHTTRHARPDKRSLYRLTGSRKRCRKSARRFQRFQKSGNLFREGHSAAVLCCPCCPSQNRILSPPSTGTKQATT